MAYIGIRGKSCPKCGSNATDEVHTPTNYPERKVSLKCLSCGNEESFGVYTKASGSNALVKVR